MKASVIVLAWNGQAYLKTCLRAILAQNYADFEVIVVDNASADGSAGLVAVNFPQVTLIQNERNLGFSGGMNVGTRAASGDVIIWLNQDTAAQPGWLDALAAAFARTDVGIAGCKIFEADGKTLNHAGGALDVLSGESHHFGAGEVDRGQYDRPADVEYVTGAAMAVRRTVLDQVGLLDERFFPGYYEDADFCLRVREAGYKVRYVPQATVVHHISASTHQLWHRRRFYYYRNRLLFLLKHLSAETFREQFMPEEQRRLKTLSFNELYAVQLALSELLTRSEGQVVSNSLKALQELVSWLRSVPPNLSRIQEALNENRSNDKGPVGAMMPALEALEMAWRIKEQPFRSHAPLIGPLIAAFRSAWNSVSARWYTLALFNQQMRFNRLLNRVVYAIAAYVWDNDAALSLLEERHSQLEQRLTQLEAQQSRGVAYGAGGVGGVPPPPPPPHHTQQVKPEDLIQGE